MCVSVLALPKVDDVSAISFEKLIDDEMNSLHFGIPSEGSEEVVKSQQVLSDRRN